MMRVLPPPNAGTVISRLRHELQVNQGEVAGRAGLDQSRLSRLESGELPAGRDLAKVLDALADLGSSDANRYRAFVDKTWLHVEQPDFWNPDAGIIEQAEEALCHVDVFLREQEPPWPLRRQLERQMAGLLDAVGYLHDLTHQIAFIGDIGVGKSTALSFLYRLLLDAKPDAKLTERVLLEAGGGRTTVCEVYIRSGPEFSLAIQPMPDSEVRELVADLCAAKWLQAGGKATDGGDTVGVGQELERAIRNMAQLTVRREKKTRRKAHPPGPTRRVDPLVQVRGRTPHKGSGCDELAPSDEAGPSL